MSVCYIVIILYCYLRNKLCDLVIPDGVVEPDVVGVVDVGDTGDEFKGQGQVKGVFSDAVAQVTL